ncbi:PREDICTED: MOXD1 homolog 1 [Dinoponera quadriceps]|uniref:MOXD1 homolog 1 n=1 Tax=Dinoponera quadriceps TaxID=609295 RepID=A0A6P3X2X9_DINQU|nr:PREDICTED: MOXD1 homolog 1 [Dinoponera quadriceps]
MLLIRLIVTLGACWIVKCDLLDLYVQHMDETMRTMLYRSKRHPMDSASRIKRSLVDVEPVLRVGNFQKQRLNFDKDWLMHWKTNKKTYYKNDALNFPNKQEENLDPDQHEILTSDFEKTRTMTLEDAGGANASVLIEITKPATSVAKYEEWSVVSQDYKGIEEQRKVLGDELSVMRKQQDELEEVAIRDANPEDELEMEMEDEKQIEVISENDRTNSRASDDLSFKRPPKTRGRVPKKYFPFVDKLKDTRKTESRAEDEATTRIKRSPQKQRGKPKFIRYEVLDEDGNVILEWDPLDEEEVTFRVTARTLGYVGIGFNEKTYMKGADILLAWVDDHTGAVNLLDSHGTEDPKAAPVTDTSQDVRVLSGSQNGTHTTVTFSRKWHTCDPQDHQLTGDTIRVLWALHSSDPELNMAAGHGNKRGGRALRLKTAAAHPPPPKVRNGLHWDVKFSQFTVSPHMDTIYWCKIFQSPLERKHHMIGYTPLVEKANEDLVHHMILYECALTLPLLSAQTKLAGAPCYSSRNPMPTEWETCLQPVLAWARGSKGEWMPEHVGIPVAVHGNNTYYMLEVHYNNPNMRNVNDSSGVRLHLTSELRPEEAGILVAGVAVSPLHLVPPRQKAYATAGYCTPHCTNTMFPEDGINIVSVVLHSHLAGRRLSLKHIRQGKELPRIVQDNHFDFDYQQSHTLEKEVKVLPGDELVAECVYGTLDRQAPTLGGYAASQEMCLAFVVHYPKTPLAACYSMTPVKDLFRILGVVSFKGMSMDELEKLFLTTGTDSLLTRQQITADPASRATGKNNETVIRETMSALKAMRDYTEERENDNVFTQLVIQEPPEFQNRTMAEHILAMPWADELLANSIERNLYQGRHMTFCRKRDDKLALPADIQNFPQFIALPEVNDTTCEISSGAPHILVIHLVTIVSVLLSVFMF